MAQTPTKQMLSLQLMAMQVPEANPVPQDARWSTEAIDTARPTCRLRLSPGEPSELVVQIRNLSDRPLVIEIGVTGDFPSSWQRISLSTTHLLQRQQTDASIYFTLDSTFFEDQLALRPGEVYILDYIGHVQIYSSSASLPSPPSPALPSSPALPPSPSTATQQLLASAEFTLHIRPDSHYPTYLPAVYREIDFMHRFLALFEQAFDPAVQTLSLLWAYLDPLTAPEAMLPFLAQWVGCASDIPWSVPQQRRLIRYALSIYRWRGTRWGLILYLHLYTGLPLYPQDIPPSEAHLIHSRHLEPDQQPVASRHICIDEASIEGFVVGTTLIGPQAMLGGGRSYHFTVRMRSPKPLDESLIHNIIKREKPAFCSYDLHITYYDRITPDV
jgi:phage tail-like protein